MESSHSEKPEPEEPAESGGTETSSTAPSLSEELVAESDIDDLASDLDLFPEDDVDETASEHALEQLGQLRDHLQDQGLKTRFDTTEVPGFEFSPSVEFDLPAGKLTRSVRVSASGVSLLLNTDLRQIGSLERYDGIANYGEGTIEAFVRFNQPWMSALRRIAGVKSSPSDRGRPPDVNLQGPDGISVRIGGASPLAVVLLRTPTMRSASLTLSNVELRDTHGADEIIERVADSLAMQLDIAAGISLSLSRVRRRPRALKRVPVPSGLRFPSNSYPHEPMMLYRVARDRISSSPLIRYWAGYQVLEYYFPKFSMDAGRRRLSRLLRDPSFDLYSDDDITRAVQTIATFGRSNSMSEREQLALTIIAIVEEDELRSFIEEFGLEETLRAKDSELSSKQVSLKSNDDVRKTVADRVYDIRCRIVHSKSGDVADGSSGLIPGSHHDDLILSELPLIEFLAQRALVSSAERLAIPGRNGMIQLRS